MTKEQLQNDINFRHKCRDYGLDWNDFEVYGDVIVLNSPKKSISVFLDQHYNIIGVACINFEESNLSIENITKECSELYSCVDEKNGFYFFHPFQNFSLKQMVELSNRIDIIERNHGHSKTTLVNEEFVKEEKNEDYISLLSYIKFLGEQIKKYWLNLYHMTMMGFEYPDVYTYINTIIANINECVNQRDKNDLITFPSDIIEYLGQVGQESDYPKIALFDVINLLHQEKITKKDSNDLSLKSTELLQLLEVPIEEIMKRKEDNIKSLEVKDIDLKSWLKKSEKKETDPYQKKI